jgi:hypothetical protein
MAIGDLVANISVVGVSGPEVYSLSSNPGGWFAISGSTLIEAINTPAGNYPITIMAVNPFVSITQSFILNFNGSSTPTQSEPFPVIF